MKAPGCCNSLTTWTHIWVHFAQLDPKCLGINLCELHMLWSLAFGISRRYRLGTLSVLVNVCSLIKS